ncbi:ribose ABC transporter, permease [Streptomyces sp. e14]|uniref:ABC transporter permease n=1 Tax=Streptomyces sp. e14 TaxID=645465 RepID=UPI0001D06BBA|nr:ABC transporter permease [Streptomyces sp. e14]EFF89097.1 ribose ABC transporter, permease [Streptomyces sp. e14]
MSSIDETAAAEGGERERTRPTWLRHLGFTDVGVVYVLIALVIVFSVWAPDTFPTMTTVRSVLNGMAVPGLMALALVVPLSARTFDLSIGNAMGLSNLLVAWLLVEQGWGVVPAILVTLLAAVVMGVFNGLVVVGARIDSFIGTLASGALFATLGQILSVQSITGTPLVGSFSKVATTGVGGLDVPLFLMLAVALYIWFFQTYTVTGRRIYALGFSERASELVGVRVRRLRFISLIVAGFAVGVAGVLLASSVQSGSPNIGPPYLLDAYAAAFLGATQFGGRFNAWGTVVSVLLITTGTNGIFLVGGAPWAQSMFSGVVLLLALGASNLEQAIRARSWIRANARQLRGEKSDAPAPAPDPLTTDAP